jgi:hypothetical protein
MEGGMLGHGCQVEDDQLPAIHGDQRQPLAVGRHGRPERAARLSPRLAGPHLTQRPALQAGFGKPAFRLSQVERSDAMLAQKVNAGGLRQDFSAGELPNDEVLPAAGGHGLSVRGERDSNDGGFVSRQAGPPFAGRGFPQDDFAFFSRRRHRLAVRRERHVEYAPVMREGSLHLLTRKRQKRACENQADQHESHRHG